MTPFLDQQIEVTKQQSLNGLKNIAQKHIQGKDRNQGQDLSDAVRPKTSTGLRGSGMYSKMSTIDEVNQHDHDQKPKMEKTENLRTHLRRSYDANASINLPHAHGIQPISNLNKFNRPHSSSKLSNQLPRQNIS